MGSATGSSDATTIASRARPRLHGHTGADTSLSVAQSPLCDQNQGWSCKVPLLKAPCFQLLCFLSFFILTALSTKSILLRTVSTLNRLHWPHITDSLQITLKNKPTSTLVSTAAMGLMWHKRVGGRRFGTSVNANRHGVKRGPWRFSLGGFTCFK